MRPSSSPFSNPSGLVDKRIGNMAAQVEQVRDLLPQIAHVSYYLESLFNLDRNLTLLSDENVDHHILKDITIFQGANAYELALVEGFVGTPVEWLASLKGEKGDTGLLDTVAHQLLIDGIASNTAGLATASGLIAANTARFSSYVTNLAFNIYQASIADQLASLEADILLALGPLIPSPRSDTEISLLAQAAVNAALVSVDGSLLSANNRIDSANALLDSLRDDLGDNELAFNTFLFANDTTIGRITALEATGTTTQASIISLETVSADMAAAQLILQAESATHFSSISTLNLVTADTATQINALQVANNANNAGVLSNAASLVDMATAYVTADEAVALSVLTLSAKTDDRALSAGSYLPNWDLRDVDTDGLPATIRGTESADTAARFAYLTPIVDGGMRISGSVDSTLGFGWPAIPIDDGLQYTIAIKHKSSSASATGLYLRISESSTGLAPGTTHVGASNGEPTVTTRTSFVDLLTNGPMPGVTEVEDVYTYTPTPGVWMATFSVLSWTSYTGDYDVRSVQIIPKSDAIYQYAEAIFLSEQSARTSADLAIVSDVSALAVTVGNNASAILSEASTRADADDAEALARLSLASTVSSNTAAISSEQSTRTSQINAAASDRTLIRSQFASADGVNAAAISAETSARVSAVSSVASSVTTLTSTVNGHTSSISTLSTTTAGINGRLNARYALSVSGGGAGAFISLQDGTSQPSVISLTATQILLNGNVLVNGSLTTNKVQDDAINESISSIRSYIQNISSSLAYTAICSVAYVKELAASKMRISWHAKTGKTSSGANFIVEFQLYRNGVAVTAGNFKHWVVPEFAHSLFGSIIVPSIAVGSSTWEIKERVSTNWNFTGGTTSVVNCQCIYSQIEVEEIKK